MKISSSTFPMALRNWRDALGLTQEAVVKKSRKINGGKHKFTVATLRKWESGETSPTIERFLEVVLEAYGISDLDVFLDYCTFLDPDASTNEPRLVKSTDREKLMLGNDPHSEAAVAHLDHVRDYRTRVDEIVFPPGHQSDPKSHPGHEYVYVLNGKVEVHVKERKGGEWMPYQLSKGDSLSFTSFAEHYVKNTSIEDAVVVVGRPSWSKRTKESSGIPENLLS